MTEEHADQYVSVALGYHEGWDSFEVFAGSRSLATLVEAFGRRGWTATPQPRAGFLLVERDQESPTARSGSSRESGAEML